MANVETGGEIFADEAYAALEPIARGDEARGFPLRALMRALASMHAQGEETIRALGDGYDSWERLWNPRLQPAWMLPFIGQAVGVQVDTSRTSDEQRTQIEEEGTWHRGTPAALIAAVQATLIGSKRVRLIERNGTAWRTLIITSETETPNATETHNAAFSQKPGGIVFTYETSDLPLIDEGTREIDAATTHTIDTAVLADVT
jgi:hypothetical protein